MRGDGAQGREPATPAASRAPIPVLSPQKSVDALKGEALGFPARNVAV